MSREAEPWCVHAYTTFLRDSRDNKMRIRKREKVFPSFPSVSVFILPARDSPPTVHMHSCCVLSLPFLLSLIPISPSLAAGGLRMAGGSGEAAMSPPSSSASGKRGRDPEEDVYVDNLHSHKRYLSEVGRPSHALLLCVPSRLSFGLGSWLSGSRFSGKGSRVPCGSLANSSDTAVVDSRVDCLAPPSGLQGLGVNSSNWMVPW